MEGVNKERNRETAAIIVVVARCATRIFPASILKIRRQQHPNNRIPSIQPVLGNSPTSNLQELKRPGNALSFLTRKFRRMKSFRIQNGRQRIKKYSHNPMCERHKQVKSGSPKRVRKAKMLHLNPRSKPSRKALNQRRQKLVSFQSSYWRKVISLSLLLEITGSPLL